MINSLLNKINNLNKLTKVFIIIIVIIIIILIFGSLFKKTPREKLKNYIINEGYNNDDGGVLYYKQLSSLSLDEYYNNINKNINSEYILSYIDIDNYEIKRNYRLYLDNVDSILNLNYNIIEDKITFNYRVEIDKKSTAIFSGEYYIEATNNFVCTKDYTNNFNATDNNNTICNKIKYDILEFQAESYEIIPDNLLKEIKNE